MMNRLFPLLLTLFLLCGCAAQYPEAETETATAPALVEETAGPAYEVLSLTLSSESAALTEYTLSEPVTGFLPLGDQLLFFSGSDATTLTLLDPETREASAVYKAPLVLTPENATVQLLENGLSYFNGETRETVVLDASLREISRIAAPEAPAGMPLLSGDGQTLYYCTATAVRAMDLSNGISRVLKEASYPMQAISGLLMEDTVVQVSITDANGIWRTLFLSAETGQLLGDAEGNILPVTAEGRFYLCLKENALQTILFSGFDGSTLTLLPRSTNSTCHFLSGSHSAVTASWTDDSFLMELYDLDSGRRTSALSLEPGLSPRNLHQTADGAIWFLCDRDSGESALCRWDPADTALSDSAIYTSPRYTRSEPDYEGLAACTLYAQEIGEKYGVEVLVYKDAVAVEPWDYDLEYEYQSAILRRELESLDTRLGNFPEGFLQTLAGKFTALKICIVRSIEGSPGSGSLEAVNGIQFWEGYDACIVLASDHDTEYALYHELSHLMETVVLTESTAYDRWDNLNPSNFQYDNDYITNQSRDGSQWLQHGKEYFIDTYSMSYAKEDRARLFEYAMTSGHEDLFRSPNLQAKLRLLCLGLREGFGLKKYEGTLLWEQYLVDE